MYKACIFDLDGTLTDTLESLTYSVNATLNELHLPVITAEQCKSFVGSGARFLIERALEASGDTKLVHIEEAMDIYGRIFKENCTYRVAPYEGIVDMLKDLKEAGIRMAVLSNKPHLQTIDVVQEFFGEDTFIHVQGQQEGVPRKPDPTAALYIAERLGVEPKECVYIGDSDVDMKTAGNARMHPVGVSWGYRPQELLLSCGAERILTSLQDFKNMID